MKKSLVVFFALFVLTAALSAQDADKKRIEFNVLGGLGLGYLQASSNYASTWQYKQLDQVNESSVIDLTGQSTFSLGASVAYFIRPSFGIQIGGRTFAPKQNITSDWAIDWTWVTSASYSISGDWPGTTAKFTATPLYLNFIGRYRMNFVEMFVSAGPTLYFNRFKAAAYSIYSDSYILTQWQWIDWFQIPLQIPKTKWTALGFNVGAGFDIVISRSIALTIEGRYFFCPAKDFNWQWTGGTYTGYNGTFENWVYTDASFETAASLTTALNIKPSFFSMSCGFKFYF